MRKQFYLPGLNSKSKKKPELSEIENNIDVFFRQRLDQFPLLNQFINETNSFFRENFGELNKYKLREKRLLDFETPNRARVVHEYDISLDSNFNFNEFYYIFNPTDRLSWLKIRQEGRRIIVANELQVKSKIQELPKFKTEISDFISEYNLLNPDNDIAEDVFFEYLWKSKLGLPCFIKIEDAEPKNFILEIEYWDSIKADEESNKSNFFQNLIFPIEERVINYEYFPLQKSSSWLYIRSPKNFFSKINKNNIICNNAFNEIDNHGAGEDSDPEIQSLTIRNKKDGELRNYVVNFFINIDIPKSLKIWFLSIYWSAMILSTLLILNIMNKIYLYYNEPIFNSTFIEDVVEMKDFNNIILAVVGGIIATRGWLIVEETILKRYSIYLTIIMILLIISSIVSYVI